MKPVNRKDAQKDQKESEVGGHDVEHSKESKATEKAKDSTEGEKDSLWWLRSSAA